MDRNFRNETYFPATSFYVLSRVLNNKHLCTQELNPGLQHCKWILYQLSYKGSPRTLEWVAYPFSSRFSNPGIELGSLALQADSLPTELPGKPIYVSVSLIELFK